MTIEQDDYGQIHVDTDSVLDHLSGFESPAKLISELVENGYDADATNVDITIDLLRKKITVRDNASGMLRRYPEKDIQKIQDYLLHKRPKDKNAFLMSIDEASARCVRWPFEFIGLSHKSIYKKSDSGRRVLGRLCLGMQQCRSAAYTIIITTKPKLELAQKLYVDGLPDGKVPTCALLYDRSEKAQEEKNRDSHLGDFIVSDAPDYFYPHGTEIELSNLKPGVLDDLDIEDLINIFSEKYSNFIRLGFTITVKVIQPDGKESIREVPIRPYSGELVLEGTIDLTEDFCFSYRINYDGASGHSGLLLGLEDSPRNRMNALKRFNKVAFNVLRLPCWHGIINAPTNKPNKDNTSTDELNEIWDDKKSYLIASSRLNQLWEKAIQTELLPQMEKILTQKKSSEGKSVMNQLTDTIGEEMASILREYNRRFSLKINPNKVHIPKPKSDPDSNKEPGSYARVVLEGTYTGVMGAKIEIVGKDLNKTFTTDGLGFVRFGILPNGKYKVKLLSIGTIILTESPETVINWILKDQQKSIKWEVPPESVSRSAVRKRSVNIITRELADEKRAYDASGLEAGGFVIINTAYPAVRKAIKFERWDLVGQYIRVLVTLAIIDVNAATPLVSQNIQFASTVLLNWLSKADPNFSKLVKKEVK